MYSGSRQNEVQFMLLHKKDLSEIRYARICKAEDKEVPWKEIGKGLKNEKGELVLFDEKDFEKSHFQKSESIEIVSFTSESEIDPVYYVKPYVLGPEKGSTNAYALLRDALKKSGKVGIARYVLRNRQHLAVISTFEGHLILNELRYDSELVRHDIELPAAKQAKSKELDMAVKLIDQLTVKFQPKAYKDTYVEEVKKIAKSKGKKKIQPQVEPQRKAKVHDIMSLLQASLEGGKEAKKKKKTA